MSLSGHLCLAQLQPTTDEEQYVDVKPFTITERTITSGLNFHEVRALMESCKSYLPALINVAEQLYHVIKTHHLERPLPFTLVVGEFKWMLHRYV